MGLKDIMDWLAWQNAQTSKIGKQRERVQKQANTAIDNKDKLDAKNKEALRQRQNSYSLKDSVPVPFPVSPGLEHMFTYQGGDLGTPLHQQVQERQPRLNYLLDLPYEPQWTDFLSQGVPDAYAQEIKNKPTKIRNL